MVSDAAKPAKQKGGQPWASQSLFGKTFVIAILPIWVPDRPVGVTREVKAPYPCALSGL